MSFDGLWDTVTGFLTGEGDDILREVARDVGTVLHNFQQQVKGIVGLLDELTGLIGDAATAFQKWMRPILVEHFGEGVGNALADTVTWYTDVQVGAVTGLIGTVSGVVAMADPDTWKGMAEMALSVAKDPTSLPGVLANMGKEFVAWDQWSGDHPGRAAGEAGFNIGSLFVPGGALSKTGSVAKGLNLSRRVLEEGRLPRVRELGSWTRGTPQPIEMPRVPEFTPASPGGVPPVRPEGITSGAGPTRASEPPTGRPPTPGAEGGSGPRAPVEHAGRGGPGAEAAPRSGPAAASPSHAPESPRSVASEGAGQGENSSAHPGGGHSSERTEDRIAHTDGESADRHEETPPTAHDSPPLELDSERPSHIAYQLNEAYLHGSSTHELARQLSDFSTHHVHDEGHLPGNVDRVVLGKWDGQDGGYIGEARANGGIYYDTGQEPWDNLTVGLSHEQVSDLGWQVNEEFLRTQMENGVSRIEYILDGQYASLEEVMVKRQGSFSAMEIEFLTENAPQYGYRRSGNTWVRG